MKTTASSSFLQTITMDTVLLVVYLNINFTIDLLACFYVYKFLDVLITPALSLKTITIEADSRLELFIRVRCGGVCERRSKDQQRVQVAEGGDGKCSLR